MLVKLTVVTNKLEIVQLNDRSGHCKLATLKGANKNVDRDFYTVFTPLNF